MVNSPPATNTISPTGLALSLAPPPRLILRAILTFLARLGALFACTFSSEVHGRPLDGEDARSVTSVKRLYSRSAFHFPNLLHDLVQIVAGRVLQRREVDVSLKFLQP